MTRFLATWLVLGMVAALVTFAIGLGVFRHVDLTFTQFAVLLVAPATQAAVLTWPIGILARLSEALTSVRRHPFASPVFGLDTLMLVGGVVWWSSTLGYGGAVTAQTMWIGVKASAGAAVCLVALTGVSPLARAGIVVVLMLVAGQALGNGVEGAYLILDQRALAVPEVVLRLLFHGGLYGSGVAVVLRASRVLNEDARCWMTMAVALSVPGALLVLLSMFNTPSVMPPWRGLALMCASASATAMLLSVLAQAAGARLRA